MWRLQTRTLALYLSGLIGLILKEITRSSIFTFCFKSINILKCEFGTSTMTHLETGDLPVKRGTLSTTGLSSADCRSSQRPQQQLCATCATCDCAAQVWHIATHCYTSQIFSQTYCYVMFQNVSKCFKVPTVVFQRLGGGCQGWGDVVVLQDDLATATAATAGAQRCQKVSWDQLSHGESRWVTVSHGVSAERCWAKVLRCSQMFSVHSQRRMNWGCRQDRSWKSIAWDSTGNACAPVPVVDSTWRIYRNLSYSPMSEFAWKTWPTFGEVLLKTFGESVEPLPWEKWCSLSLLVLIPRQLTALSKSMLHNVAYITCIARIACQIMSTCSSPSCSPIWFPSKSRVCSLTILSSYHSYRSMHSCHTSNLSLRNLRPKKCGIRTIRCVLCSHSISGSLW